MTPRSELESAIVQGEVQRVRELLKQLDELDVNRNARDSEWQALKASEAPWRLSHLALVTAGGKSLVHLACAAGSSTVLALLLDEARGNLINCDSMERLPLHLAVESGDLATVSLLLERLAAKGWAQRVLGMADSRHWTPIALACAKPALLGALLDALPADPGDVARSLRRTPLSPFGLLHRAVLGRSAACVAHLLATGAASELLRDVDGAGRTALVAACAEGETDIAMTLIGAKVSRFV